MSGDENKASVRLPIDIKALWEGCMLALSVHAVMLAEYPFTLNEHTWIEGIYQTQDNGGMKAALVFSEDNIPMAGVFRSFGSPRTRLILSDKYANSHFKAAPAERRELAGAVIGLFEEPVGRQRLPVVTTGCWLEENSLISSDSYEDWFEHGGSILENQMKPFEEAMDFYKSYYSMDEERAGIAERIYKERIRSPWEDVVLTDREIQIITQPEPYNTDVCREVFGRIHVVFEH